MRVVIEAVIPMHYNKTSSIKRSLTLSYIVLLCLTLITVLCIVFILWKRSNDSLIQTWQQETQTSILNNIETVMDVPIHINVFGSNLLDHDVVDLDDPTSRDPYFASVISGNPDFIYSYSFGSVDGEYYGARRTGKDIQLMVSNANTDFHSIYYNTTPNFQLDSVAQKNDFFDPRTRAWYIEAVEADDTVFSPVYKHFIMDDLAVSVATPIHNVDGSLRGVLGTHLVLNNLNTILDEATEGHESKAYILEYQSGDLIANSSGMSNYETLNNNYKRLNINNMDLPLIANAYTNYLNTGNTAYRLGNFFNHDYISVATYESHGIHWLIILSLPDTPLNHNINLAFLAAFLGAIVTILISLLIWNYRGNALLNPISDLTKLTEQYSQGNYMPRSNYTAKNELGQLGSAFNMMAEKLSSQMHVLEKEVKRRTSELEDINRSLQEKQENIIYLSYHDQLTGLFNRRYFEESLHRSDNSHNLPISIIMIDMNGLKLINDAFGHKLGDTYLRMIGSFITRNLRSDDIAARLGGDEFVILLPHTNEAEVEEIASRIHTSIEEADYELVPLSVSFGHSTKNYRHQSLIDVQSKADEIMYQNKLMLSQEFKKTAIKHIINHLRQEYPHEDLHANKVRDLSMQMGQALSLPPNEQAQLGQAAYMHDIGKIALPKELMDKTEALTPDEYDVLKRHPEIGYRILSSTDETAVIAETVLYHHENWDGTGYPKGIAGENIPLMSRILRVSESYITMTTAQPFSEPMPQETALQEMSRNKGIKFQPELVDLLFRLESSDYRDK